MTYHKHDSMHNTQLGEWPWNNEPISRIVLQQRKDGKKVDERWSRSKKKIVTHKEQKKEQGQL